tara:strand:+ start:956 stop:1708 length:753 start_codon:yes stop_codon:yes gene_type:complete
MKNNLPISCFIIAKNEADRISNAIKSVKNIVDEIIIIDSGSTDNTKKICEEMGCKVFYNKWEGFGPQKRKGEDYCKNDWILNLDADEYLSEKLKIEINDKFLKNINFNFFSMKVVPIYPSWKNPRLFSAHHQCVRLYNKKNGRFSNSPVHDSVITGDSDVFYLKNPILHNSVRSYSHLIEKENSYIQLQSKTLKKKNKIILLLRLLVEFPMAFLKYYLIRRHFTGALTGLITALILAYFRWKRILVLLKN